MTGKIDISPAELVIVQGILKDHLPKGTLAWAFGSRVTWTAKPFSDLDIALEGAAPLASDVLIDLEEAFDASDLPWKVDLIDLNAVSPEFRAIVERQRVPADWRHMSFAEAGIILLDCDHKTPAAQQSGRPYVGIPQMTTGRVDFASARKISEADFVTWTRKTKYQKDDVILSRRTNPGVTAVDDTGTEFALGQNLVLLRADGTKVFPPFLRWIVHSPAWWAEIEKYLNVGAVFSSLRCGDVPKFEFSFPPTWEQENIARILRALDDKIELNRRMNETLEAMARAVFRDWFVDFGPTRRKAAGITDPAAILGGLLPDPTQAPPLAALFPDSFGANGLPEGWDKKSIYDFAKVVYGAPFKSTLFNSEKRGRPLARIRDLPKHEGGNFTEEVHKKEHLIHAGDIVVGMDGEFRAYLWQGVPTLMNQRVCSFIALRKEDRGFVWLSIEPHLAAHESSAIGTTVIHLGKGDIDRFDLVAGSREVLNAFSKIIEPMIDMIVSNGQENQTLAATRDLLLPKLMSGEIRLIGTEGLD